MANYHCQEFKEGGTDMERKSIDSNLSIERSSVSGNEEKKVVLSSKKEIEIDKSGENKEQKDLREKIKKALEEAVRETVARINSVAEKENPAFQQRIFNDLERIEKQIRDNIDGYSRIILRYLKNEIQNPRIGEMMRIEARRMVANSFANSHEIRKLLPKGKISREISKMGRGAEFSTTDEQNKGKNMVLKDTGKSETEKIEKEGIESKKAEVPIAATAVHSGAEIAENRTNDGEKLKRRVELTEEQKRLFEELSEKFPFQKIEDNMGKNIEGLSEEDMKDKMADWKVSLEKVRKALMDIAVNFSRADVEYFRDNFMDQILDYFLSEVKKMKGTENTRKFKTETMKNIRDLFSKKGFSKEETEIFENYFWNVFNIEYLIFNQ